MTRHRRYTSYLQHDECVQVRGVRNYGCLGFIGDVTMIFLTGGLWLIWIFVREMRRR